MGEVAVLLTSPRTGMSSLLLSLFLCLTVALATSTNIITIVNGSPVIPSGGSAYASPLSQGPRRIAGSVTAPLSVCGYFEVQVVDGATGAVIRSHPLDPTRTFAFTGLPLTASEVRLFPRLPGRRYRLNTAASTLAATIPNNNNNNNNNNNKEGEGDIAWLHLVAVVDEVSDSSGVGQQSQGSLLTAFVTSLALVAAVLGRHQIIALLHLPAIKIPKPRKMVMTASR